MILNYDLTIKIWFTSIYEHSFEEDVEYWLDDDLLYSRFQKAISEIDKKLANKIDKKYFDGDIEASDILYACKCSEEEITLKEIEKDHIILNVPLHVDIEKLKKDIK